MDRWNNLYKSLLDGPSFESSKQSGNRSTTSDMMSLQGSLVEERSIVWNGNNSFADPDDMCRSEQEIPGTEAAKELLWEVQAFCLRAKSEAQETVEDFFSEEEKKKRTAQQAKCVKEFEKVGKACKATVVVCGDHADAFLAFLLSEHTDIEVRNDLDITETLTQDYTVTESDGTVTTHSVKYSLQWKDDDTAVEVSPSYTEPELDSECDDVYLIPIENHDSSDQGETSAEEGRDDPETDYTTLATDTDLMENLTSFESVNDRAPVFASESEESGLDFKLQLPSTLSQDERNVAPLTDRGRMVRGNTEQGKIENIAALQRRAVPMSRHTDPAEESVATQPKSNVSGNRGRPARHVSSNETNDNFDVSDEKIGKLAMAAIAKARLQKASINDPSKSVIDPYRSHHSRTGGRNYGVIRYANPIQHINLVNSQEPIDLTMYDDSRE